MAKTFVALLGLLSFVTLAYAEPSQYCNYNIQQEPGQGDFCMAVDTYKNQSSNNHDLYITLQSHRRHDSALGWTAIAIGSGMGRALCFVLYGDPTNNAEPILHTRRANGHWEPRPYDPTEKDGKIRVELLDASWKSNVAQVAFVCYSCDTGLDADLDSLLDTTTTSQPWIWAKNSNEKLAGSSEEVSLGIHSLTGGYGYFSLDMARTINSASEKPSSPKIQAGVQMIGAEAVEEEVLGPGTIRMPSHTILVSLHGFFMTLAFLLLLPLGVVAIVSGWSSAFKYHWIVQMAALFSISIGVVFGFLMRPRIEATHQKLGLFAVVACCLQALLGYLHHIQFIRLRHRTWISHTHIHLGRIIILTGYVSAITGMLLHGAPMSQLVVAGVIMSIEVIWIVAKKMAMHGDAAWEPAKDSAEQADTYQLLRENEK